MILGFVFGLTIKACTQDIYEQKRKEMVDVQIEKRGITHQPTLKAMRKVERHLFVPEEKQNMAYFDQPLSIGNGQTISQPYIVAYMTAAIQARPGFKVLEIGTGSGYQAAVLAEIVDSVFTVEIVEDLGKTAAALLQTLGYNNVVTRIGDGFHGWKEHAPFDAILVTCAPGFIPPPLVEQLKEGGRMIIPVGDPYQPQELLLVKKTKKGKTMVQSLLPVRFVPLIRD